MIVIERTENMDLVRESMTHKLIYPHISDDGSPTRQEFVPIQNPLIIYLHAFDDLGSLGIFMLHPHNTICYEVHTCLNPRSWGNKSREAAINGRKWMFENTKCGRIITNVPEYNVAAKKFSEDCGMVQFGINEKSFLKNGKLYNQLMFGISKD